MPGPVQTRHFDIAQIVCAHRAQLQGSYALSRSQKRVLTDIANCRTAALGGHLDQCAQCGHERPSYNSCRNRHCPKCQALAQDKWIAEQQVRMLDVQHFHVVFTLPAELRALASFAPQTVLHALFAAAASTLLSFGERHLKATVGATMVLHTWTRDLRYHPHVHCIVTGGGLLFDGLHFSTIRRKYLFNVKNLGRVFRGKMLEALSTIYRQQGFNGFDSFNDPQGFARLIGAVAKLRWNVYSKPSFANAKHVIEYLGRYTHRVGIANSRLVSVSPAHVTFRTKNGATATLSPVEFVHRLVQHVLPDGFHKIRHIGLYASKTKRDKARMALNQEPCALAPCSWRARLTALTGRDVGLCPVCRSPMTSIGLPACRDESIATISANQAFDNNGETVAPSEMLAPALVRARAPPAVAA